MTACSKNVFLKHIKSTALLSLLTLPLFGVSQSIAQQLDLPIITQTGQVESTVRNEVFPRFGADFGFATSISGNRVAISAPDRSILGTNSIPTFSTGTVFIFERNANGEWVETAEINRDEFGGEGLVGQFGFSLVLEGDRLLVGTSDNNNISNPAAFVYEYTQEDGWVLDARLTQPDGLPSSSTFFSHDMDMQGDTIVIGSERQITDVNTRSDNRGQVYVYQRDETTGEWLRSTLDRDFFGGNVDLFGGQVELEGNTIFVGAPSSDKDIGTGRIFTYSRSPEGAWLPEQELIHDREFSLLFFGRDIAAGAGFLVTGGAAENSFFDREITLRSYENIGGIWQQSQLLENIVGSRVSDATLTQTGRLLLSTPRDTQNISTLLYLNNFNVWVSLGSVKLLNNAFDSISLSTDGRLIIGDGITKTVSFYDINLSDSDQDSVIDLVDNCVVDANADQNDADGDGLGNVCDDDDDGDSVLDVNDRFPLDQNESIDTDGDGTGNNADNDDDGDGVADSDDVFPLDPRESIDTDGDGTGNNADTDDDNDGLSDNDDNCSLIANPNQEDIDSDGTGDVCDETDNRLETDDDEQGNIDASNPVNLNSWGSGFNASFEYVITDADTAGGTLREWRVEIDTNGGPQITNAWINSGYNAAIRTSTEADLFVVGNEGQGYIDELVAGDVLAFTIQGRGSDNNSNGINLNFISVSQDLPSTGSCDNPISVTLPFSFTGEGEHCWEISGTVSAVNSWATDSVEINGSDFTNRWSNSLPGAGPYTVLYDSDVSWGHFEINGSN